MKYVFLFSFILPSSFLPARFPVFLQPLENVSFLLLLFFLPIILLQRLVAYLCLGRNLHRLPLALNGDR